MSAPKYRHMPQSRAALSAAGYADPNVRQRRTGPDFSRNGNVLYPETDEAQEWIDESDEHELDFSGGIYADDELIEKLQKEGFKIEGLNDE